jgi:hypothetical protein
MANLHDRSEHAVTQEDQFASTPLSPDATARAGDVGGVDLRTLPPGTEVVVDTSNSHYRFVMLDGGGSRAVVRGGLRFDDCAEVRIVGSTFGGTFLRIGWIEPGLFLELSVDGKRLGTSRIRSVSVVRSRRRR